MREHAGQAWSVDPSAPARVATRGPGPDLGVWERVGGVVISAAGAERCGEV